MCGSERSPDISVYITAVAPSQNSKKDFSPTSVSAAIFPWSCTTFLGFYGTCSLFPSQEKKPVINNRFEKRRTISPHGSSYVRLCHLFGLKENTSFKSKGVGSGGHRSISEPSYPNESKNTKSPHYNHYCQISGNQLADTGQTDIREK